jgi:hypothetical protein
VADEEERPRRSDVINEITVQIELRDERSDVGLGGCRLPDQSE